MKICTVCGDRFLGEEVSEWRAEHEEFSLHPFICPDCWDRLQRKDLEDQLKELVDPQHRLVSWEIKEGNDENTGLQTG